MSPQYVLVSLGLLVQVAQAQTIDKPEWLNDKWPTQSPGADQQYNVGSSAVDPSFANATSAERVPARDPPGWLNPTITAKERTDVRPEGVTEESKDTRQRLESRQPSSVAE